MSGTTRLAGSMAASAPWMRPTGVRKAGPNAVNIDNFGEAVPADVKKLAEERRDGIKAGKLHPFTGPLKDQSGKEFLAAGKTYTDPELKKMNFYVEGVEGSIPK